MFWNVRNLSRTITRPGVRGLGLPPEERAWALRLTVDHYLRPDLVLLVETGVDSAEILGTLFASDYWLLVSPVVSTDGETYTALVRKDTNGFWMSEWSALIPGTGTFRQGVVFRQMAMLPMQNAVPVRDFIVLHARATTNDEARLQFIDQLLAAYDALPQPLGGTPPVVFVGDFNFKADLVSAVAETLPGFQFLGPGTLTLPLATSVRTWITSLAAQETLSEPYDLAWARGLGNTTAIAERIDPVFPAKFEGLLAIVIFRKLEAAIAALGQIPAGPGLPDDNVVADIQVALDQLAWGSSVVRDNQDLQMDTRLTDAVNNANSAGDAKGLENASLMTNYFTSIKQLMVDFTSSVEKLGIGNLNSFGQNWVLSALQSFNLNITAALSHIGYNINLPGFGDPASLRNAIFAAGVSDHLPILICIPDTDTGLG